tara:strand:- start:14559 stop:15824 length:1266 start_codon:yes stop_codon:yes gene_type:complete
MSDNNETTIVNEVELDNLSDLLGAGADSIMVPNENEKKPNVLSSLRVDTAFLDKPEKNKSTVDKTEDDTTTESSDGEEKVFQKLDDTPIDDIVKEVEDEGDKNPGGRPTLNKDVMVETASKLIEKGVMFSFDDDKKIEDYSAADWEELLEANFTERENKLKGELPNQFMASLPPQLQKAYEYHRQGGEDMVSMFNALGAAEQVAQLDSNSETGQESIIRAYYQTTQFGTAEEIEEEIDSLRDRDELKGRAERYKPRLDQLEEQTVQQKIQAQADSRKMQEDQAKNYQDSIYDVLKPGKVNGLEVDGRTQEMLFAGLIQPNYPSISGKPTTMLGHLLEKYQWVEPNHNLIAETLWLLADPDGYKEKIRSSAVNQQVKDTVRTLKTEESNKTRSSSTKEDDGNASRPATRKIARKKRGFFERD